MTLNVNQGQPLYKKEQEGSLVENKRLFNNYYNYFFYINLILLLFYINWFLLCCSVFKQRMEKNQTRSPHLSTDW